MHDVVAGLLLRDGRVLLGHRSPGRRWYPGVWDVVGGHVEPGEDERTALLRELREEIGVEATEVDDEPVLRVTDGEVTLTVHVVRAWRGEPRNLQPAEHDELRWVGAAEVHDLELAHPSYAGLVEQVAGPAARQARPQPARSRTGRSSAASSAGCERNGE